MGCKRRPFARTTSVVAALVVLTGLALPATGSAVLPKPIGEPGGIYTGTIHLKGNYNCSKCSVRIALTEDGLEIKRNNSYLAFRGSGCAINDVNDLAAARLKTGGAWQSDRLENGVAYTVVGRLDRHSASGHGKADCLRKSGDTVSVSYTFSARLKSRSLPPASKVVHCEAYGSTRSIELFLEVQRGLGCGLARAVARGKKDGLTCAPTTAGKLDPAARTRCTHGNGVLEVVRLRNCTTADLGDYGASNELHVLATGSVTCDEAQKLGRFARDCEDDESLGGCKATPGFACKTTEKKLIDTDADLIQRCADPANLRRVVLLAFYSSDVV